MIKSVLFLLLVWSVFKIKCWFVSVSKTGKNVWLCFFVVQAGMILVVTKELTFFSVVLIALQVLVDQSKKANSPLKGHERTVQYLQHLGECEPRGSLGHLSISPYE